MTCPVECAHVCTPESAAGRPSCPPRFPLFTLPSSQTEPGGGPNPSSRRSAGWGGWGRQPGRMAVRAPPPQSPRSLWWATGGDPPTPGSPPPRRPPAGGRGSVVSGPPRVAGGAGPGPAGAGGARPPHRRGEGPDRLAGAVRRRRPPEGRRAGPRPRPPPREGLDLPSSPAEGKRPLRDPPDVGGEARPSARRVPANARLTRGSDRAKRRRSRRPGSRRSRASRRARR